MTTTSSSFPPPPWNCVRGVTVFWGALTLAIASSVGLSPALAVDLLNPAAPAKTGVKPASPLGPWMLAGVTEADESMGVETDEPAILKAEQPAMAEADGSGGAEISSQASNLLGEPAASAAGM